MIFRFRDCEFDARAGRLLKGGREVSLRPQQATLLEILARRAGEVVLREELYAELWPGDTHVDYEHGLNFGIRQLRLALGDDARSPTFIETLPRRGYRFLPAVERRSQQTADAPRSERVHAAHPCADPASVATRVRLLLATPAYRILAGAAASVLVVALAFVATRMPPARGSASGAASPDATSAGSSSGAVGGRPAVSVPPGLPLEVERAYVAARYLAAQSTVADLRAAEQRYKEVITAAPGFAAARSGLASLYNDYALAGIEAQAAAQGEALAAARAALALDPASAEAHTAAGIATLYLELDWPRAVEAFERALAVDPDYEPARWWRAHYLVVSGQSGEALRTARAARLGGTDGDKDLAGVGWLDYLSGRFDEAAVECRRALDLDGESLSAATCLLFVAGANGDANAKVDAGLQLLSVLGTDAGQIDEGRALYAAAGAGQFWGWYKGALGEACPSGALSQVRAFVEMLRERPSAAVAELEAAVNLRSFWAPFVAADPAFAPLRGRPEFESLLATIRTRPA